MTSFDRVRGIMFIWAAFAVATAFAMMGKSVTSIYDIFLVLILSLAAVVGTAMVTRSSVEERSNLQALDKTKRGKPDFYDMLDSLDEAELDALRQRLGMDEGERASLESLMNQQKKSR
ncbi:MAG: hypothetical protein U0694_03005 [Anaerolineae bacterium]